MTEPGAIVGRVVDDAGEPVPSAAVSVTEAPAPHPEIALLTTWDGRFHFRRLAPGEYALAASASRSRSGGARVQVEAGAASNVEILLRG